MYCKLNAKVYTKIILALVLHFNYNMRTLNKEKLSVLQKKGWKVLKNQAQNDVTYFSYVSLALAMSTSRRKIHWQTARYVLKYLKKKDWLTYEKGKSHQKSKIVLLR